MGMRSRMIAFAEHIEQIVGPLKGRVFTSARNEDGVFLDALAPSLLIFPGPMPVLQKAGDATANGIIATFAEHFGMRLKLTSGASPINRFSYNDIDIIDAIMGCAYGFKSETNQTPTRPVGTADIMIFKIPGEKESSPPLATWLEYKLPDAVCEVRRLFPEVPYVFPPGSEPLDAAGEKFDV